MMFCKPQKRVSPLPALSEVFKKILWNQITEYFNLNYLFHEAQYGFRKNHSTELGALHLTDNITQRMEKENTPIAIYLDLSKAFDTINHFILLDIVTMLWVNSKWILIDKRNTIYSDYAIRKYQTILFQC